MEKIDFSEFDVVSFDIFDTLLHRLVLAPVDVFEMVRLRAFEAPRSILEHRHLDNFLASRMQAEVNARNRRVTEHGGEGEITLNEIYAQWQIDTGANDALADWLKEMEITCEARILHASVDGKEFYDAARAAGCTILLISDMYLPPEFLREVMIEKGFEGITDVPIYVSGEVRLSKHVGTLFAHVAKTEGLRISPRWLHVGDNMNSDVTKAQETGITAYHATWAVIHNIPTVRNNGHGSGHLYESLTQTLRQPHARNRLPKDPLERIGYQVWGPMLFGFTCWLIGQFQANNINHAVFVARDGWLMEKLFKTCTSRRGVSNISSEYFLMSRKTGFKTGVRDWHPERTWFYVAGKNHISARRAFAAAGLNVEQYRKILKLYGISDVDRSLGDDRKPRVVQALNAVHMSALRQAAENRETLAPFYDASLENRSRIALIDIGWVGNIQRLFLQSTSDPTASERVFGFYLGLHKDYIRLNAELGMSMQGWMNGSDRYEELNAALLSGGVELLEFILSAPHGSTIDLKKEESKIVPVMEEQSAQEIEYRNMAARAQAGVLSFVEDYAFLLDWMSPQTLSNAAAADAFLKLVTDPDDEALAALASITHSDSAGSNDERLVLAPVLKGKDAKNVKTWSNARKSAFWKAAFDKLNPYPGTQHL